MRAGLVMVGVVLATGVAHADEWHAGLNLRSELGAHAIRVDGGVRLGRLDLIAVLDPMWWTDGECDVDIVGAIAIGRGYEVYGGWRPASIALDDGRQFQHAALVGVFAPLPTLGPVELTWGFEIGTVIVKHGGGLPSDVISFDSTADVGDNVNVSMFLRVGVGREI